MEIKLTDEEVNLINTQAYKSNAPIDRLYKLYYMRYKKNMAPSEMVKHFDGLSKRTLQRDLKIMGWEYTSYEAQQMSAKKKDYATMYKKIRVNFIKSGGVSNAETAARELLSYKLHDLIDGEVIIGINDRYTIKPYEIDIPIVVITDHKIYKYAVEFNGNFWHDNRQGMDAIKSAMMVNAGYKPFVITQMDNTAKQREYGSIESQIDSIVKSIKKDIRKAV